MKLLTYFMFISIGNTIYSQPPKNKCEEVYNLANALFLNDNYDLAIKKLSAYKLCNEKGVKKADLLLLKIFEKVNNQKEDAIKATKEALKQKNIANLRASVIITQKDSIEKENASNIIATQALQVNDINPNTALQYIYKGLCISPNNLALNEIRRKILNEEILFKKNEASNNNNT